MSERRADVPFDYMSQQKKQEKLFIYSLVKRYASLRKRWLVT